VLPPTDRRMDGPKVIDTLRESLRLLATRRFGTFWFASLLSSIGTWAQQVAEPWLLLSLGASSFVIGLDSFAMSAPVWLLTLLGGALADRSDRRRVIAIFQSVQMLCPTAIVVLLDIGWIQPWMIVSLSIVVGVTDALSMPSFQSIVPTIVRRDEISRGLALNSTQFNLSRILGPAIAGLLISGVGPMACFIVSAASYVPFIGVALWILPRWVPANASLEPAPQQPRSLGGVREVLRQRTLRGPLLTVLVSGIFCAPLVTFSPVLVREAFHGNIAHFSTVLASFGAGGLLGAIVLLGVAPTVDRRRLSTGFALGYAAVVTLAAADPWLWGMPPLLALAGATMTMSNTAVNSFLQATTSPRLLGRTVSLYMLAMRGGMSLGALFTGATVGLLGVKHALLVNGLAAVGAQLAVAWFHRAPARAPSAQ